MPRINWIVQSRPKMQPISFPKPNRYLRIAVLMVTRREKLRISTGGISFSFSRGINTHSYLENYRYVMFIVLEGGGQNTRIFLCSIKPAAGLKYQSKRTDVIFWKWGISAPKNFYYKSICIYWMAAPFIWRLDWFFSGVLCLSSEFWLANSDVRTPDEFSNII